MLPLFEVSFIRDQTLCTLIVLERRQVPLSRHTPYPVLGDNNPTCLDSSMTEITTSSRSAKVKTIHSVCPVL